jgi:putative addiction module killer protein
MEVEPREIRRYIKPNGTVPFAEWLATLRDVNAKIRIDKRLLRVRNGNLGDCRSVGEGVYELKIDYGPGYRVYFGQAGVTIVLILCGGDKSTQDQDIVRAKEYWKDYEIRQSADQ